MLVFLIPANLSGLFFLDTPTGVWITVLGAGALAVNTVFVLVNGGFSRVLALPHVLLWGPLQIILAVRLVSVPAGGTEWWLALTVFVINGISLVFDVIRHGPLVARRTRGHRLRIGTGTILSATGYRLRRNRSR